MIGVAKVGVCHALRGLDGSALLALARVARHAVRHDKQWAICRCSYARHAVPCHAMPCHAWLLPCRRMLWFNCLACPILCLRMRAAAPLQAAGADVNAERVDGRTAL